jgi:hypothetical protein
MNSLDFLKAVYSNSEIPLNIRLRAAIAAAPYEHPKLAFSVVAQASSNFADRLELAYLCSASVARVIEAKPVAEPSVTDLRLPPASTDRRLRRI